MNILRLIGQRGLLGPDSPVRHEAKRRRIKTVIQELIYRAGRLINTGLKLILGLVLGANDRSTKTFARLHGELFAARTYPTIRATSAHLTDRGFRCTKRALRRGQLREFRAGGAIPSRRTAEIQRN